MEISNASETMSTGTPVPGSVLSGLFAWLKPIFWPLVPFMAFIAVYSGLVYVIANALDLQHLLSYSLYGKAIFVSVAVSFVVIVLFYIVSLALVQRERRPLRRIWRGLRDNVFNLKKFLAAMLPVIILAPLISAFTSFKSMIGLLNPFHLDPLFADIDRVLHFGFDPWQITHALTTTAGGTFAINYSYNLWFIVMWGFVLWQVLRLHKPVERQQFFLAFGFCWGIIGTVFAFLLSSAGPCYYGDVIEGANVYAPLMERLYGMHAELKASGVSSGGLWALNVQENLWSLYTNKELNAGAGISAMPSLHVSIATLMACAAWQASRKFGVVMIAYLIVIVYGSVHLGWHYAIDGYVSVPLTLLAWKLAGWIAARFAVETPSETPQTV